MQLDKFTTKAQEAVEATVKIASERHNQELHPEHLLLSLLGEEEGIPALLIKGLKVSVDNFRSGLLKVIDKFPSVEGGEPYVGKELNAVFSDAQSEAEKMGDEFVSVEHLMLGMVKEAAGDLLDLFKEHKITHDGLIREMKNIRRGHKVTDQNPEAKYMALKRYGRDLVRPCKVRKDRSSHRKGRRDPEDNSDLIKENKK